MRRARLAPVAPWVALLYPAAVWAQLAAPPPAAGGGAPSVPVGVVATQPLNTSPNAIATAKGLGLNYIVGASPTWWDAITQPTTTPPPVGLGTVISFKYGAAHNVYQFTTEAAWTACTIAQGTQVGSANIGGGDATNANLYEGVAAEAGTLYFACGVGTHCTGGQKVKIGVMTAAGGVGGIGGPPPPGGIGGLLGPPPAPPLDCSPGGGPGFLIGWLISTILVCLTFGILRFRGWFGGGGGGRSSGGGGGSGLPKGWQESTAPDGRQYYYNKSTGATSWERPAA